MGHPALVTREAPVTAAEVNVTLPLCYPACPGVPWEEQRACVWKVEKEMTLQKSRGMRGPEGRSSKLQPSPEGLGINPKMI
jgi:hypothetical protein